MEYRFFGRSGVKVSSLALGAMTFGRELNEAESHAILDHFVEAGGNFIDTADAYGQGASEAIIGNWLASRKRDDMVVATKVRYGMGGMNNLGLSRRHIIASVDASLRRLKTDYIDLYQVHCWDAATALEETLSTLDSLVRSGKVRYIGASNYNGWQLQKSMDLCKANGWEPFSSLQPQYNLLCRQTEWELIPVSLNEGLSVLPWSPLRGGWLSGKFYRGMEAPPADSRIAFAVEQGWGESWPAYNNEHTWKVIDALHAVSKEVERLPANVAVRWLLQKPGVTSPIIGVRRLEQLTSAFGALDWTLSDEHMAILDAASAVELPYPYEMDERSNRTRQR